MQFLPATGDPDRYFVYIDNEPVGEVILQLFNEDIAALSHIDIYREFRGKGYGKQIVQQIFHQFDVGAIIGESLRTSAPFWRNCIQTFGGYTSKDCRLFGNTAFAFVLGTDIELDPELVRDVLQMCAQY